MPTYDALFPGPISPLRQGSELAGQVARVEGFVNFAFSGLSTNIDTGDNDGNNNGPGRKGSNTDGTRSIPHDRNSDTDIRRKPPLIRRYSPPVRQRSQPLKP